MQKKYIGIGSIENIKRILFENQYQNVFVVSGKQSYEASGAQAKLAKELDGMRVTYFNDISPNPTREIVQKGIESFQKSGAEIIIAVGGGSAIDTAKAINALTGKEKNITPFITGEVSITTVAVPLVAVPTTSGSGSEATHFAVVYIDTHKYSIAHHEMQPTYAIVDPTLTYSLPAYVTACCGFDALAQAIEAYWSIHSTKESKTYSRQAIPMILNALPSAVSDNQAARIVMAEAAYLAGQAINIAKTTASHAMSYAFTSQYDLPHGHAVAVTLPRLFLFNSQVDKETITDIRGVAYVQHTLAELMELLGVTTPEEACQKLTSIAQSIGLEMNLRKCGVKSEDIDVLLQGFSAQRAGNNPRYFDQAIARTVLMDLL